MLRNKTTDKRLRSIPFGDVTIELSPQELRMGAVSYLWIEPGQLGGQKKYAAPAEVLQARFPDINFQVSEDGYATMRAKAERIEALKKAGYYDGR